MKTEFKKNHVADNEGYAELKQKVSYIETALNKIQGEMSSKPIIKNACIYDLGSEAYSLRAPLNILIEVYEDEIIAKFPEVEVWGSGGTESEAILDFKGQLVAVYEDLLGFEKEDKLGKLPKMWLRILGKIIIKNK